MNRKEKMQEFYRSLNVENIDIPYYADEDNESFDDLYSTIEQGGGFDVDIIYYSTAIKYLMENDPSLKESLGIASEFGYEVDSINSELLASLLASQNAREEFQNLESEIEAFFEELNETSDEQAEIEDLLSSAEALIPYLTEENYGVYVEEINEIFLALSDKTDLDEDFLLKATELEQVEYYITKLNEL